MVDETKNIQGDKDEATNQATDRLAEMRGEHPADAPAPSTQGRPTPTQDELDRIVRGENVTLEPDGSPPDPHGNPADQLSERHKLKYPGADAAHAVSERGKAEAALRKQGWKKVPEKDEDDDDKTKSSKTKDAESDGDKAAYKTREAHAESHGRPKVNKDKEDKDKK